MSVAKALTEQLSLVGRARPAELRELMGCVRSYVESDLRRLDVRPATLVSAKPSVDPLESILYRTSVGAPGGFLRPPTFFPDASDVVSDAAPPPEGALFAAFLGVAANASFSAVACAGLSRGGAKGGGGARARARAPPVVDERYPPPPPSSSETSDASETFAKAPFSFRAASSFASFATSSHHVPCARVTLSQNTFRRPLLAGRRGGKPPR